MPAYTLRPARADDTFLLALLHNGCQEPHFHTTAAKLWVSMQEHPERLLVAEHGGHLVGSVSAWLPDFHPGHVWLGFNLHPDHRGGEVAGLLFAQAAERAREAGRTLAWTSVRADYLSTSPDLGALGFREVHRTFGGGFYLDGALPDLSALEARLLERGVSVVPAAPLQNDPRLTGLYAAVKGDKVTAEPTISTANAALHDPDSLWDAAFVAIRDEEVLGLALPERAGLGAWNAVLLVRPDVRRQGIGTALQARVCNALAAQGTTFLNTAGVKADAAYLGVLRRLGANIEPDWVAYEAALP